MEKIDRAHVEAFIVPLLAGAAARCTAAIILAPMDVIKTRLQFKNHNVSRPEYSGIGDAVRKIWAREGAKGFYHGLPTRLIYIAPAAALSFAFCTVFVCLVVGAHSVAIDEQFKSLLNKRKGGCVL